MSSQYRALAELLQAGTPVWRLTRLSDRALGQVEQVACDKLLHMLPRELQPDYEAALRPADPAVEELVKAADKLSAHIKCLEELKAGNGEFRAAAEQTRQALERMDLPEVKYFCDNFLGSFSLTLDEME